MKAKFDAYITEVKKGFNTKDLPRKKRASQKIAHYDEIKKARARQGSKDGYTGKAGLFKSIYEPGPKV